MTTLIGEKIVLRPHRMEDAEAVLAGAQNPVLRRLTGTQATFTREQVERYLAMYATVEDRVGFVIADPQTLVPLGEVILMDIDPLNRCAVLRITLFDEAYLNKGYGTEALRLVVDYAFEVLNLHRVGLDVFDFNARAIRVYEKIGFRQEGVQRDTLFYDGEFHSSILMSILEEDWRAYSGEG